MAENKQLQFSQGSLQDFAECERRYYYRYRLRLAWPAAEMEPISESERLRQLGSNFHLLVQQYLSGVPDAALEGQISDDHDLSVWWRRFLELGILLLDGEKFPEIVIRMPFEGSLLVAKFDLLYLSPDGGVLIYDWKTSLRRPDRFDLASRWQSILYPYLIAAGGQGLLPGEAIDPDKVMMEYWFTNFPQEPIRLDYSAELHRDHERAIRSIIETISPKQTIDEFPLTTDETRCRYCVYRSLCDRGTKAGQGFVEDSPGLGGFDLDIDQIQEVEL